MQILSALVCFHCSKTHSKMHVQMMAKLDINRGGRNMRPTSLCSHHKAIQTCLTTLKCFTNFHRAKEPTETQLGSYLTVAAALYLFVLQLHPQRALVKSYWLVPHCHTISPTQKWCSVVPNQGHFLEVCGWAGQLLQPGTFVF